MNPLVAEAWVECDWPTCDFFDGDLPGSAQDLLVLRVEAQRARAIVRPHPIPLPGFRSTCASGLANCGQLFRRAGAECRQHGEKVGLRNRVTRDLYQGVAVLREHSRVGGFGTHPDTR